jgi:hypothetical protein
MTVSSLAQVAQSGIFRVDCSGLVVLLAKHIAEELIRYQKFDRFRARGAGSTVSQLWRQTMNYNEGPIVKLPVRRIPWNKGKLIGAKHPLRPQPCLVDPDQTSDRQPQA